MHIRHHVQWLQCLCYQPADVLKTVVTGVEFSGLSVSPYCAMSISHHIRTYICKHLSDKPIQVRLHLAQFTVSAIHTLEALAKSRIKHCTRTQHNPWRCLLQTIHKHLLAQSASGIGDSGHSMDAGALPLSLREAAFVEAADCFVALIARPQVSCLSLLLCKNKERKHSFHWASCHESEYKEAV